ncbi:hypothetical protein DL89DRAFT_269761 [Linderina pennispora]|uniref:PCI domain-containing protein n=1 Tax=Linderina pennispora TaxID=61395 RepID=A0A1Y1VZL9_9FUNG|nr:uncharacterized protein DL89DRAFT_269761 [Linderina pennispora]ORX66718.1 hypothetical protein DL89DRAFT_269761 [Linderina pennispora]
MSDDDFMYDEDDNYEFEYDEDEGDDQDVGVENKYYNAKAMRDEFEVALQEFQAVISEEDPAGDWGFRATKQIIKLYLARKDYANVLEYYSRMLDFVRKSIVTRNYAEKSINNMLERFTMQFYQRTLGVLKEAKNDRLWLRTSLRLAKLLLDQKNYKALREQLGALRSECVDAAGAIILERGTQLLEINAMYLSMYADLDEPKKLKDIYTECVGIKSAISHPRVLGLIRECGGKMFMSEQNWEGARSDFFESFKNYDEAGSPQRIQVLKYLVLASMLSESEINPFASPETKSYRDDPSISAMTNLVTAYEQQDLETFERILRQNPRDIENDTFIKNYIGDLRRTVRMQALQTAVAPYTRLLIALILDKRLMAKIDQENAILILEQQSADSSQY